MNRMKRIWNEEPVVSAAGIAAVLGLVLGLIGVEVSPEGLESWSGAFVAVITGIVYVISSLKARGKVSTVESVGDGWVPQRAQNAPNWDNLTPEEKDLLAQSFFRRGPDAGPTPGWVIFMIRIKAIVDKLYKEENESTD